MYFVSEFSGSASCKYNAYPVTAFLISNTCVLSGHKMCIRDSNSTDECSILYSGFNDRTSIETNTDNIACSCVRTCLLYTSTVKDINPATIRMIGYEGAEYDRYDDDGVSTL